MLYVAGAVAIVLTLVIVARLRRRTANQRSTANHVTADTQRHHNQIDPATGVLVGGLAMNDAQQTSPSADTGGWGAMSDSSGSFDGGSSSVD